MTEFETLAVDVADRIMTVTLSRPEKLNAFNATMRDELIAAFDMSDADDVVRAVIVTGAGRAFCAGADLSGNGRGFANPGAPLGPDGKEDWSDPSIRDGGGLVTLRIFRSLKPVIAACNGPAVGIGATMQLAMDIRLASDTARYGFVFARRGIVPEACSSWFLPRIVGISRALEWCYSGRVFGAEEARESGLVRSVHQGEGLLPAARAIAAEIAENTAPVSVALTRQMMWRMMGAASPMEAHRVDSRGVAARVASADVREGVASFLEKRPAAFSDRVSTDMPGYFPWWTDEPWQ
ncbi:crotonase/enoyl-CoA hydratase family protein [Acuticoccus sediminis]|uniref:crotonase/enoyl-CoA hydratase family protein n=1 Tax=Acuticoccus sediminis TaxID=2184697 RepID=UPI001CFF3E48|nr:crotonase/enoyl-CoA hydratase family protein [Acuticoccus sediminis]